LLKFNANVITKEYYVNDYGSQIKNFALSVYYRILEITENKTFPNNLNLYPGIYIVGIAKKILINKTIKNFSNYEKIYNKLAKESLGIAVEIIKNDLSALGIKHDNFVYESKLIKNALVQKTINKLEKQNLVYRGKLLAPKGELTNDWKDRQQLLFKSTNFTDDIDRPLTKADQSWTYFASDIAYHANKIDRKFNVLINILGADHTGYIKRISAAVLALSNNKINLICKVTQLVKLLRKGEPFKMSKRKGDYITAKDLVDEVGKDSVRFIMLNRSNEAELDFDFDKVTEKSKENPVFYVQYAYARINSIFRSLHLDIEKKINFNKEHLTFNKYEIEILKKVLEWPKCVTISSTKLEPHRIPVYLYDLVTLFHAYWNMGKIKEEYRFIINNKINNKSRLALLKALSIVIKNGMSILGVSTPKRM
jgi:arginyl-tRNA synthetase